MTTPPIRTWPTRALLTAAAGLGVLAGCESLQTVVEVRNESRRAVRITLEQDVVASSPKVLTRHTLGAGDAWLLGPVKTPPFEPAMLRVTVPGSFGGPAIEARLPRGRSDAVIEDARVDAWGSEVTVRLIGGPDVPQD